LLIRRKVQYCILLKVEFTGVIIKKMFMEICTLTNDACKKQLLLKKNTVVKFIHVNRLNEGSAGKKDDTETTTGGTFPTTSIIIYTIAN
jgi:hypothetical protein